MCIDTRVRKSQMKKILILEDKKENIDALTGIITEMDEDIKLYPTSRTEDAYQTALEKNIDVFLVDIV